MTRYEKTTRALFSSNDIERGLSKGEKKILGHEETRGSPPLLRQFREACAYVKFARPFWAARQANSLEKRQKSPSEEKKKVMKQQGSS